MSLFNCFLTAELPTSILKTTVDKLVVGVRFHSATSYNRTRIIIILHACDMGFINANAYLIL